MGFQGFDVYASDGNTRHFPFAHQAKEYAKTLVEEKRVAWAMVKNCEDGLVIKRCGGPDSVEEAKCKNDLKSFCNVLSESSDIDKSLKLLMVRDAAAGTCFVRFGSLPRISGSGKLEERVDVILDLVPGSLENWAAGRESIESVCRNAKRAGVIGLAPYAG